MSKHADESDALAERIRDARLDNLIERAERAAEPCADCEVGEPHVCPSAPPDDLEAQDVGYIRVPGDLDGLTPAEESALRESVCDFGLTPTNDISRYSRTILPAVRDLLAARERAAAEKALRDAADDADTGTGPVLAWMTQDTRRKYVAPWLRDRAARIARGGENNG